MTREGERVIELANELASRMGHLLTDMVPPAAQVHLVNAQRELITALMLIYEHRVNAPAVRRPAAGAAGAASRRTASRRRQTKRVGKIPVD